MDIDNLNHTDATYAPYFEISNNALQDFVFLVSLGLHGKYKERKTEDEMWSAKAMKNLQAKTSLRCAAGTKR